MINFLFAEQVEIRADKFIANEIKGEGLFLGNVRIIKGEDILNAKELIVNFDKKRKPTKYTANGDVNVSIKLKGKMYFGSGDRLIYEPKTDTYKLEGNAFLEDKNTSKKVYGSKIEVNQKLGKYQVDSKSDEPVKFIFQINDGQKWQK